MSDEVISFFVKEGGGESQIEISIQQKQKPRFSVTIIITTLCYYSHLFSIKESLLVFKPIIIYKRMDLIYFNRLHFFYLKLEIHSIYSIHSTHSTHSTHSGTANYRNNKNYNSIEIKTE